MVFLCGLQATQLSCSQCQTSISLGDRGGHPEYLIQFKINKAIDEGKDPVEFVAPLLICFEGIESAVDSTFGARGSYTAKALIYRQDTTMRAKFPATIQEGPRLFMR